MSWRMDLIEKLQEEEAKEREIEHGYLKNLDKCDMYDLMDRGIDTDANIPSLYR